MATNNINIRIDAELKHTAEQLFSDLGLNMTTAINIFLRQAVRNQAIPFTIKMNETPNRETLEAMAEAELLAQDPNSRSYSSVEELFEDLNN